MADLLPCPFCGDKPHKRLYHDEDLWSHDIVEWLEVGCGECGTNFTLPTHAIEVGDSENDPVARWNKRV